MLKAFFEYVVLDKISSTKFNIVDFKLNPVFELAYNKKKVLSSIKNNNNSNNTKSNLTDSLPNSKVSNSDNFVLNGSPTRSRRKSGIRAERSLKDLSKFFQKFTLHSTPTTQPKKLNKTPHFRLGFYLIFYGSPTRSRT